jgi:glycosyltransferase involved in cell wall biosynthesis
MSGNASLPGADATLPTVLQIAPLLAGGGIARATLDIAAAITAAGGRAVVVSAGGPMTVDLQRLRVPHVELPVDRERLIAGPGLVRRLAAAVQEHGVGIVHARSRFAAWLARGLARRTGARAVATVHWPLAGESLATRRYEAAYAQMDRLIAVSRFIAADLGTKFPDAAARARLIPSGINLERFSPGALRADRLIKLAAALRLPDDRKVVLVPGRLVEDRGQLATIEAIKALGRGDVFCLLLGGSSPRTAFEQALEARIEALGLGGIAQIGAFCDDMPAAYMLADVVVAAGGPRQGFSRVLVEAQAMSRPVVSDEGDGRAEGLLPGRTGWTVPAGDTAALARAIGHALDLTGEERARLSLGAARHVEAHFALPLMAERTLALYRELATPDG